MNYVQMVTLLKFDKVREQSIETSTSECLCCPKVNDEGVTIRN